MFIIKILINEKEIREIMFQNTGKTSALGDTFYELKKPKVGQPLLAHDRKKGDLILALKTLRLVQEQLKYSHAEEEDD